MFIATTLSFYKQPRVQRALIEHARNKEIAVKFNDRFGKRPEALFQEGDVLDFAKKKATSFHASEELWSNPLLITTGMSQREIEELRIGWDLILDIDCPYWPLSKLTTHLFIKALRAHGVRAITVKFSGNKGFHIGVPFQAFPATFQGRPTKDLFPEAPRRIAHYLLDYIRQHYVEDKGTYFLFDKHYKMNKDNVFKATGKEEQPRRTQQSRTFLCHVCGHTETTTDTQDVHTCTVCGSIMTEETPRTTNDSQQADPLSIIEVDTVLIAHRHLYRTPYSFHEKTQLISTPLLPDKVLTFSKQQATPKNVDFTIPFLDREAAQQGEATKLLIAAYDYQPRISDEELVPQKTFEIPSTAIPQQHFPPCIRRMLNGMKDGRKRTLFTLINFLKGCGWSQEQLEQELNEWNKRNEEPLREVVLKGQLRYASQKKEIVPPHNCKRYYQDLGVCTPDNLCSTIKNPLQYAKKRARRAGRTKKKPRRQLSDEQKKMRRKHKEQRNKTPGKNTNNKH